MLPQRSTQSTALSEVQCTPETVPKASCSVDISVDMEKTLEEDVLIPPPHPQNIKKNHMVTVGGL